MLGNIRDGNHIEFEDNFCITNYHYNQMIQNKVKHREAIFEAQTQMIFKQTKEIND